MEQNTKYVLSLSYGKDSLACLGAIEQLGLPLDGIIHSEVWATKDIPADLPPMVEFKAKADAIIKARWGLDVIHTYATRPLTNCSCREREREDPSEISGLTNQRSTSCTQEENTLEKSVDFLCAEELGVWELLLKWDADSPVTFKADGHTVHDFDRRFQFEDDGIIDSSKRFLWKMIDPEKPPEET